MLFELIMTITATLLALMIAVGTINVYYFFDLVVRQENRERIFGVWLLALSSIAVHATFYIMEMVSGKTALSMALEVFSLTMGVAAMGLLAKTTLTFYTFSETKNRLETAVQERTSELQNTKMRLEASHKELKAAYDELKTLDRMKSELLSNVSHELMTPLTVIKCVHDLMVDDQLSEENKKLIKTAKQNTRRLEALIEDLLFYARLEYDPCALNKEKVDLGEVISKSLKAISPNAYENDITIETKAEDGLWVFADRKAIQKVFSNLLNNAIKFNKRGGTIRVSAMENTNGRIEISIEDTGIGIPEEHLVKIFNGFYQVDGTTKRKYSGTGMGLSVVKSIVEKHGGSIRVESQVGIGSKFTFEMPKDNRQDNPFHVLEAKNAEERYGTLERFDTHLVMANRWSQAMKGVAE